MRVISSSPSPSGPSSSRGGGTFWMSVTSPSAGAMIRFSSRGVTRTGSRKNASTQTVNMIKGHVSQDRKSKRLNPVTNEHLVCRLLLEKKKIYTTTDLTCHI